MLVRWLRNLTALTVFYAACHYTQNWRLGRSLVLAGVLAGLTWVLCNRAMLWSRRRAWWRAQTR